MDDANRSPGIPTDTKLLPPALVQLAHAIEARDPYTAGHLWRLAQYAESLAGALGYSDSDLELVRAAVLLHDLGKIAVPEALLARKGLLEENEIALMRHHPRVGHQLLSEQRLPEPVLGAVLHHHERWDGIGYPDRLKKDATPELARLIGLCDAYENMTSWRPYRKAPFAPSRALIELNKHAERQFDPRMVKAFAELADAGALPPIFGCSGPGTRVVRCLACGALLPLNQEHQSGATIICPGCHLQFEVISRSGQDVEVRKTGRLWGDLPP
jgi:putative nucleotidyltransferase with HDIG domain